MTTLDSTGLARAIVEELISCGVQEAVLCPGSRNAPLSFALAAADAAGALRLHVRIDERTAAFLALGLAKASGHCVPVVCTSGTAVANLHPAMLEASHAGVPLMALTADRPLELFGSGANQTTDQARLFGGAPRWTATISVGMAERPARSAVDRAVGWALGALSPAPGPVHLNIAFAEPLVPASDIVWSPRTDAAPATSLPAKGSADHCGGFGGGVELTSRTLTVVGSCSTELGQAAADFAVRNRLPLIAEPVGPAWGSALACGPLLLAAESWLATHLPDQVLVVGRPTLSRPVARLISRVEVRAVGITDTPAWADASAALAEVLPAAALREPARGLAPDTAWLEEWSLGSAAAATAVQTALERSHSAIAVTAAVIAALSRRAIVTVGSSNPIRDIDLAARPRPDLTLTANRGLSGIDGTISTAIGTALATPDRRAFALMGDLTFLHDSTALIIGPEEPRPDLTIVVVNDDGGGIFGLLEQGGKAHTRHFERIFGTPTGTDVAALCAASHVGHTAVADIPALIAAIDQPQQGISVIEVKVDRASQRDLHAELRAAVVRGLG